MEFDICVRILKDNRKITEDSGRLTDIKFSPIIRWRETWIQILMINEEDGLFL